MRIYEIPIAHRGLHSKDVPENSMQAFELAVEKGFNIETDVHLTKDGEVVCFHDFSLKRMLGGIKGGISSVTLNDLKTDDKYKLPNGETIPTLQ